jgi:ubiquinone biosynthesis protein COQ4
MMSASASVSAIELPVRPAKRPHRDWPRAFRAIRRLFADNEDTTQVFEIMQALNGDSAMRGYLRLLRTDDGGRIAYERVELADKLMDADFRASFPPGSVGAAYVHFIETEHLSAQGLVDESHKGGLNPLLDPCHPYAWFGRRIRDVHDIWHILTGYGRDALGEICMTGFSYGETHALGWAMLSAGGYLRCHGPAAGKARKAIWESRQRAKKTKVWLLGEDHERLLFENLEACRRRIGLTPPVAYEAVPPEQRHLALV